MISTSRRAILQALACAAIPNFAFAAPSSQTDPLSAPGSAAVPKTFDFAILRNGSKIGDYTISIVDDGATQTVDFTTNIKVDVLMFTAYHLTHSGQEIWTDGRFVSYKGQTNDNGKIHDVSLVAGPQYETLMINGQESHAPKGAIPATFWNSKFVNAKVMVIPDDGTVHRVEVIDLGLNQVMIEGAPENATHYHIQGLARDIWMFDGNPVRVELKGTDNSTIVSQLMPSPAGP